MSRSKVLVSMLGWILVVGLISLSAPTRAGAATAMIEKDLIDKLSIGGTANFFVRMSAEADLSAAYGITDWKARGRYVHETLTGVAEASQAPIIQYAKKNGLAYKSFFTINAVYIKGGNLAAVQGLAALPGVAELRLERILEIPEPIVEPESAPLSPEWGILDTKADEVWSTFAVRGAGIKVSSIDTGVQWNHPALVNQFACPGAPTDPKCWDDPSNVCGGSACDNNGHGTHTMGTMVGYDGGANQIGMAPEATWIACKGCESSSCSESALNGCADWILAPGGSAANRPHIVNNSWGGSGGDTFYQAKVIAWRAAGIFPSFSAGNNGSGCSSMGSPGDYQESFASAAHDSTRTIASFSSRGPSAFGHDPYTKPNISSPGVNVRSSVPTDSYANYSGTSMASPHTAGAVALLWSGCSAYLGQIDQTFQALQNAADAPPAGDCGAPPDSQGNYTYGYGYLDILTAATECMANKGTLEGYVRDSVGNGIAGATVLATPAVQAARTEATTDPTGKYTMRLAEGTYDVTASKDGYTSQTVNDVPIVMDQTTTQDFSLSTLPAAVCLWCDMMERGRGGWTHGAIHGTDDWTLVTTRSRSASHAWFSNDVGSVSDKWLRTAAKSIPADVDSATLSFWHNYDLEHLYDGAVVEVSTDGTAWTDLGDKILSGAYTDTLKDTNGNPIGGREAWSGSSGRFVETKVDLTDYKGMAVMIRFRLGTDASVAGAGWWIDDVCICTRGGAGLPELLLNGSFESGTVPPADNWLGSQTLTANDKRVSGGAHAGSWSFQLKGDGAAKKLFQNLNEGGTGGKTFTLSLWVSAANIPATGTFGASVLFYYSDGTTQSFPVRLARGKYGWRLFQGCMVPAKSYTKLRVAIESGVAKGGAKFDEVSLRSN